MSKRNKQSRFGVGGDDGVAAWLRLTAQRLPCCLTTAPRSERTLIGLRSQDKLVKSVYQLYRRKAQAHRNVRLIRRREDAARLN